MTHAWADIGSAKIQLQEEQSADFETRHVRETFNTLWLGDHLVVQTALASELDPVGLRYQTVTSQPDTCDLTGNGTIDKDDMCTE